MYWWTYPVAVEKELEATFCTVYVPWMGYFIAVIWYTVGIK